MTNQDKIQLLKEQLKHLKEKIGDNKPDHLEEKFGESEPGQKMQALQEAQEQFDDLIERMIAAKTTLTGLSLGANEVSVDWE
jgi:uncharacterized coiled-coil protein SlyX